MRALETHRQPLHDVLRGIFEETKTGDPADFVNALLRNLTKMLWFPPKGWTHPGRETAPEGESDEEWDEMERLAEDQRRIVTDIAWALESAASEAEVTGVKLPGEFD